NATIYTSNNSLSPKKRTVRISHALKPVKPPSRHGPLKPFTCNCCSDYLLFKQADTSSMKRVFLIDAMSHIFRAYFAPMGARQDPLRNSKGQVTQAIFVFTNMLRKLLNDEKPDYIAAVFDTDAPTFRDELFA